MGHSKSTMSIVTSGGFRPELTRDEAVAEHAEVLKAKNAAQTMNYVCRYILPLLPNGSAKVPAYYAIRYGVQFLLDTQQHGAEYAAKKLVKTIAREQIVPMATALIWSHVEDKILVTGTSKALAKPAEEALGETLSTIIEEGVDAL
jgi:hypothetical protein